MILVNNIKLLIFILISIWGNTMAAENTLLLLIKKLSNLEHYEIHQIEALTGCKFHQVKTDNLLDELIDTEKDGNQFGVDEYISKNCTQYPTIEKAELKVHKNNNKITSKHLAIILHKSGTQDISSIKSTFGNDPKFITQSPDVPKTDRCYLEYDIENTVISFTFLECDNLQEIHKIDINQPVTKP